jgi:hypothetical protein
LDASQFVGVIIIMLRRKRRRQGEKKKIYTVITKLSRSSSTVTKEIAKFTRTTAD